MRLFSIAIRSVLLGLLLGCTTTCWVGEWPTRINGIDPVAAPYANEWLSLAKMYGLKINDKIDLGIQGINKYPIVGECFRNILFTKIIIDEDYWYSSDSIKKTLVVFHEMGHCYCNRDHDYSGNISYGEDESSRKDPQKIAAFYQDNCPKSIMYPFILQTECYLNHYSEYIDELFKNCEPNE